MSSPNEIPLFIINAVAPIRICDNGGWTDTWFADHGRIFNIAVSPYVEVQVAVYPAGLHEQRILIHAENFGDRYLVPAAGRVEGGGWGPHPLLEAAIEYMHLPENLAIEISIYSQAPAGASTGTSAAVSVALIGALDQLTPGRMSAHEVALAAQRVETEMLGQQCGIQDQLCSAYGGINYIEVTQYPYASVSPIYLPKATWWELERRLALIYLGNAHNSSQVHEMVIRGLEDAGADCPKLETLRQTAPRSRDALYAGDFQALGQAMVANTEAQRRLHPALVSRDAGRVIEIARRYGALGWKVNGAGGEGGSLTLLCGSRSEIKRAMIAEIEAENTSFRNIPIQLSRYGLRVWKQVLVGGKISSGLP
jgi:D-glycero-alpha-D-manno-heptose-7-phosphate kinase